MIQSDSEYFRAFQSISEKLIQAQKTIFILGLISDFGWARVDTENLPKVIPDHRRFTVDLQSAGNDPESEADKLWLHAAVRAYLTNGASGSTKNRETRCRIATMYWLWAINSMLVRCTGGGLERFASPWTQDAIRKMIAKGQCDENFLESCSCVGDGAWLALPLDMCSVGLAASHFLKNKLELLCDALYDPSHRAPNDVFLALKKAGQYIYILLMGITFNCNHGPFGRGGFGQGLKTAAEELVGKVGNPKSELFTYFLDCIARDMGEEGRQHDEVWQQETFASIATCRGIATKGPKLQLTRWDSWSVCCDFFDSIWHRRLVVLLYYCLSHGFLDGSALSKTLVLKGERASAVAAVDGAETGAERKKAVASVRSLGKNTVHTTMLILAASWPLQRRMRLIMKLVEPIRKWSSWQARTIKDARGALSYYVKMAGPFALEALICILKSLLDVMSLQRMGFFTEEADLDLDARTDPFHPQVLEEDEW